MNVYELLGRPVVMFDTETTGVDIKNDRILQIAAIRWDAEGRSEYRAFVDPGPDVVIPPEATAKHGIDRAKLDAEKALPSMLAIADFLYFCSGVNLFVAHNATYDLGLLAYECQRNALNAPRYDFICTNALALFTGTGIMRPNRGGYMMLGTKLEEVAQALGLTLEGAHDAGNDIAMVELILPHLYQKAVEECRPILNAMIHRRWLADRGEKPQYVPPRAMVYLVA